MSVVRFKRTAPRITSSSAQRGRHEHKASGSATW